jgi:hypothetical protein
MRAVKFILFGILLVLTGTFAPPTIAGLLYANSGTLNPLLGPNGFYLYLIEAVLIGLGLIMGLTGLFLGDPIAVPPVVDLPPSIPMQASQQASPLPQETLPSDFR